IGMLPYLAEATGNLVGEEQLDGQQTRHYHYDQEGLHFSGYYTQTAQASADVWVSTEHEVYIKATLHWEGEAQDLGKGSFDLESRVTDINQPITITAPEGVTPPELPDDVVLMGDARELALVDKLIYYQTNRSPFEVADYYKFKMPAYGWALEFDSREQGGATDESKPVTMRFSKTGKILNMSAQSGPPTLVILAVVPTE
ncbi:MAG: hypothetical protein H5T69_06440, partial [Chloroflexi bacterium]|nr:hypothetical protein [Chloroflexota bacterium]